MRRGRARGRSRRRSRRGRRPGAADPGCRCRPVQHVRSWRLPRFGGPGRAAAIRVRRVAGSLRWPAVRCKGSPSRRPLARSCHPVSAFSARNGLRAGAGRPAGRDLRRGAGCRHTRRSAPAGSGPAGCAASGSIARAMEADPGVADLRDLRIAPAGRYRASPQAWRRDSGRDPRRRRRHFQRRRQGRARLRDVPGAADEPSVGMFREARLQIVSRVSGGRIVRLCDRRRRC